MSAWPEQKSMSGSEIATSVTLGGPEPGVQRRRSDAEVVPASYLPQASTFPVGSRLMWRGTMSQATGASQAPVVAWVESALRVTVAEVTDGPPVLKRNVCGPAPAIPRSTNLATPLLLVVIASLPCRVPVPLAIEPVTVTPGTTTPFASFTTTVGCRPGIQTSLSIAPAGGWTVILRVDGAPASSGASGPVCRSGEALSPVQVSAPAARAAGSTSEEARRRRRCMGTMNMMNA